MQLRLENQDLPLAMSVTI